MVAPDAAGAACVRCHSEHNGRDFAIVRWEPSQKAFDHAKTGLVLDGKHVVACEKCHNPQRVARVAPVSGAAPKNVSRTFLGLSRACASCHEDKHRGELGANCLQCHNTSDWKAAKNFDHSKTKFALTGAHRNTACEKCHTPQPGGALKYTGLKFDRCAACHTDVHKGEFKQGCESCHNTSRWKQTTFAMRFDHSKTKYALVGKHLEVSCTTCHRKADFKTPIAHDRCMDCHTPDPHNGQFARRKDGGACESCHTVEGFKQAKFGVAEHRATGFPLREKHADVACAKCHIPAGRATVYRVKFDGCIACHKDVHTGQFAAAPNLNRCENCHTERTFRPSTFTLAKHQQTFALTGSHLAVACMDCHRPAPQTRTPVYHMQSVACAACHTDPHKNQFASRMKTVGANGKELGCQACHSTSEWHDLNGFDHANTRFQLVGAHRSVTCTECHRPPALERTMKNVNFTGAPTVCQDCHQDPHGAQFVKAKETRCADCHNSTKWRPSLFDHDKTAFSLRGAHQNVRCAACHTDSRVVDGKKVLFYKPTPTKCAACHGNSIVAKAPGTQPTRRDE